MNNNDFITPANHINFLAKKLFENKIHIIAENDSFIVEGNKPHSVWNNSTKTTIMVGITIKGKHETNDY